MSIGLDFDFARYIATRRGQVHQRARDGAAYAFSGERKVRRTLNSARPVAMAIEAATRTWKSAARNELLGTSVKVTDQQFPQIHHAARKACLALHLESMPKIYVAPASSKIRAQVLGTNDEPYIIINSSLVDRLNETETLALVGRELGHVQNNHVVYATALHYLSHAGAMFVRWIVKPAVITLQAWSRRAQITSDRAALLATSDLDGTLAALVKLSLGLEGDQEINIADYLEELPDTNKGFGKYAELFRSDPYLPKRVRALRLFAESTFYRAYAGTAANEGDDPGLSADEVDRQVSELLSVF